LRNPAFFFLIFISAIVAYVTYQLNLWVPIMKMMDAASRQAMDEGKRKLREFLEASEAGREAIAMSSGVKSGHIEEYEMSNINGKASSKNAAEEADDDL
jgi:protein SEY1